MVTGTCTPHSVTHSLHLHRTSLSLVTHTSISTKNLVLVVPRLHLLPNMNLDTTDLPPAPTARYIGHDEQGPYVFSLRTTATVLFLLLQAYHKSKYDVKPNFIITFSEFALLVKYRSLQELF